MLFWCQSSIRQTLAAGGPVTCSSVVEEPANTEEFQRKDWGDCKDRRDPNGGCGQAIHKVQKESWLLLINWFCWILRIDTKGMSTLMFVFWPFAHVVFCGKWSCFGIECKKLDCKLELFWLQWWHLSQVTSNQVLNLASISFCELRWSIFAYHCVRDGVAGHLRCVHVAFFCI